MLVYQRVIMTSLETLGSTVSIDLHLPGSLRVESVAVFAPETASSGCLKAAPGSQTLQKREVIFLARNENNQVNKPTKTKQNKKSSTEQRYKYLLRAPQTARALAMWASGTRKSLDSSLSLSHYHQLHRSIA